MKILSRYIIFIFAICNCSIIACHNKKPIVTMHKNKTADIKTEHGTYIITAEIVTNDFEIPPSVTNTEKLQDYFIRRSVQDYFIKFCEGNVTVNELDAALSKQKSNIKNLKMEVAFKEGMWDVCDEKEAHQQSRDGKYVILLKIFD